MTVLQGGPYLSFIHRMTINKGKSMNIWPMSLPSKGIAIGRLYQEIMRCRRCSSYRRTSRRPVPGEGNLSARLMIVGEAPNNHGDRPFIGATGRILEELLEEIGLSRREVYLTNLIKCSIPTGRRPKPREVLLCAPYLEQEIKIVRPRILVPLGRYPTRYILSKTNNARGALHGIHGRIYRVKFSGLELIVIPTYHPAATFYNSRLKTVLERDFSIIGVMVQKGVF